MNYWSENRLFIISVSNKLPKESDNANLLFHKNCQKLAKM
jgi:hypothetical protein